MRFMTPFVLAFAIAGTPAAVLAQQKKSEEDFVKEKPAIGDALPDVTVYSPDGKEFKTSELRGHYTVLTFGCLT
jgi:cytochrome oxidase Cu insertion factor (SCO1/SenC/PrrC family)